MLWARPLPEGILATVRGDCLFLQNANNVSTEIGGRTLPAFGTMFCEVPKENSQFSWDRMIMEGQVFPFDP